MIFCAARNVPHHTLRSKISRMSGKPDWAKRQTIIAGAALAIAVIGIALHYAFPSDPQHPIKFDFIYQQISISLWQLLLTLTAAIAVFFLVRVLLRHLRKPKLFIEAAFYGADSL